MTSPKHNVLAAQPQLTQIGSLLGDQRAPSRMWLICPELVALRCPEPVPGSIDATTGTHNAANGSSPISLSLSHTNTS